LSQDIDIHTKVVQATNEIVYALQEAGLGQNEARVVVLLLTRGSLSASEIGKYLNIQRTEIYRYITTLTKKNILEAYHKNRKTLYSVTTFEDIVKTLMAYEEVKFKKLYNGKQLVDLLQNTYVRKALPALEDDAGIIQVIEGHAPLMARMRKMVDNANETVMILATERYLAKMYNESITDDILSGRLKVGFKTPTSNVSQYIGYDDSREKRRDIYIKKIEMIVPTTFLIIDDKEMIMIFDDIMTKKDTSAVYTTNKGLINTFKFVFAMCN